jgi:uncharacterized protein (DUF488 family)
MTIYTIGHSHAAIERFIERLRLHPIQGLIDTRSQPCSRYAPQFNREPLNTPLQRAGITYRYLGDQLGGRPREAHYYLPNGTVDYARPAEAPAYREGLERLKHEAERGCLAIMCSEADYRKCHRYWLITRSLVHEGVEVHHIVHSGQLVHTRPEEFSPAARQPGLFEAGARETERF